MWYEGGRYTVGRTVGSGVVVNRKLQKQKTTSHPHLTIERRNPARKGTTRSFGSPKGANHRSRLETPHTPKQAHTRPDTGEGPVVTTYGASRRYCWNHPHQCHGCRQGLLGQSRTRTDPDARPRDTRQSTDGRRLGSGSPVEEARSRHRGWPPETSPLTGRSETTRRERGKRRRHVGREAVGRHSTLVVLHSRAPVGTSVCLRPTRSSESRRTYPTPCTRETRVVPEGRSRSTRASPVLCQDPPWTPPPPLVSLTGGLQNPLSDPNPPTRSLDDHVSTQTSLPPVSRVRHVDVGQARPPSTTPVFRRPSPSTPHRGLVRPRTTKPETVFVQTLSGPQTCLSRETVSGDTPSSLVSRSGTPKPPPVTLHKITTPGKGSGHDPPFFYS